MAYFDSKKNRALWEIELQELRKEKAARAAGKVPQHARTVEKKSNLDRGAIRTSYKELLKEEALASKKSLGRDGIQKQKSSFMESSHVRAKEGMSHEMR